MKNTLKALKPYGILAFLLLVFLACDREFTSIESDVLGQENSNFSTNKIDLSVLAYNRKLDKVQLNGLSSNLLGVYDDPLYGQTVASIVTQITPTSFDPDFGENPSIDSVMLNIPYFSRADGFDDNGNTTYTMTELDSLYGDGAIKLSIYRNNYFLRDFNPSAATQETQNYYSFAENTPNPMENFVVIESGAVNFDAQKGDLITVVDSYTPSNEAIEITQDDVSTFSGPALRIPLDTDFWKTAILDKEGGSELSNASNFRNYFRGLYIKAEAIIGDSGNMQLLNLGGSNANITIYYTAGSGEDRNQSTYSFNFTGIRLNTLNNTFNPQLVDGNSVDGDESLFLKGSAGSMAIIDLFPGEDLDGNNIPDQLDDLKSEFVDDDGDPIRLINQAQLVIYEDESVIADSHQYDRLYAYDVKNNITLIDYGLDPSTDNANQSTDPLNSTIFHLGARDTIGAQDDKGFKIRITEHIKSIIFRDSLNTKLGLVISNNVNYVTNAAILDSPDDVTEVPASTLLTSRGTILNGSNRGDGKNIVLEIFYSNPTD